MVKIDFTELELSILHSVVRSQLYRLLQAKEQGHKVDEASYIKEVKRKDFCKVN